MADRDLRINVTETGAAETAASLEAVDAQLSEMTAANTANAEATEKSAVATREATLEEVRRQAVLDRQALLLNDLSEAQGRAAASVAAMAEAASVGGKKYAAAITEAGLAVAKLEEIQAAVRAQGGPVSPADIAALVRYDAAVTAAAAATARLDGTMEAAHIEAGLMRGNMLGLDKAIVGLAGSGEGLGATFAKMALPIGAVLGAMAILPLVFDEITKGAEYLGAKLSDVMNDFDDASLATQKAGESAESYQERVAKAAEAASQLQQAAILMGAGLIQETTDREKAIAAMEGYHAALTGVSAIYPEFTAALKKMGVNFKATHEEMADQAQLFGMKYREILKRDGEDAAAAFAEANKSVVDRIVTYYQQAGLKVPEEMKKIADSIALVSTAEKQYAENKALQQKYEDTTNATEILKAQIEGATKEFGTQEVAVQSLSKEINDQIKSLTDLKTAGQAQDAYRKVQLQELTDLAVKAGILTGKFGDLKLSTEAQIEVDRQHIKQLEEAQNHIPRVSAAYGALQQQINATTQAVNDLTKAMADQMAGKLAAGAGHTTPEP